MGHLLPKLLRFGYWTIREQTIAVIEFVDWASYGLDNSQLFAVL